MNRTLAAVSATLALAAATAAHADSFTPASSTTSFSGVVDFVHGSPVLTCDMTMTIVSNGAGTDASVASASLTGGFCGLYTLANMPWNIDVVAPVPPPAGAAATKLRIKGVRVIGFGACGPGDIDVNWNPGPPATITFPIGTTINPGGCVIAGSLEQVTGPALTITN